MNGVRTIALLEAAKAALVLAAGLGLLGLVHRDVHALAAECIEQLHLNPARKYPRIFLDAASKLTDANLWMLAAMALAYAALRGAEAYGLWRDRRWAEWLGAVSGAIYLPVELYELWKGFSTIKFAALAVNLFIVAYLVGRLRNSRREPGASSCASEP